MSNSAPLSVNDSASPLTKGERIEVRGFARRVARRLGTLTLPSPLERAR
jgi:hypothetical protein